jgi:biofilm PGA synthesis N-glycosyltransferase PgaC
MAVVVSFLNEASHLPTLLASIAAQTEPPDELLLVDDGSVDGSHTIAAAFAREHPWARTLELPQRTTTRDRLADASVVRAFHAGVEHLAEPWDIVVKLDGDLDLNPDLFRTVRNRFSSDPRVGITGSDLSVRAGDGTLRREYRAAHHVPGPNKFYRRQCFEQISPIPAMLGWDTIDDLRARLHGWKTESFALGSGESIHLRPRGGHDGRVRAYRRFGGCAWAYGAHPLWVLLGGIHRMRHRPYILPGLLYILGWIDAAARRSPRAESAVREQARREELAEIARRLSPAVTVWQRGAIRR